MIHVGLHSVVTHHKKIGWENKKIQMYFVECQLALQETPKFSWA
jgi:hypothetical protein